MKTSSQRVTVRKGESLDLFCDSVTPYQVSLTQDQKIFESKLFQWCYWAHNGSEYPTTSHKGGGEIR